MLQWDTDFKKAIMSLKNSFPHLLFRGNNEDALYKVVQELLTCLGRSVQDTDILTHDCENNGGISAVRDILRPFTRGPRHARPTLIVLKRFDRLSHDAQFALRRTMEIDQDKCRCIATCTGLTNIIQPILSRFIVVEPPNADASETHYVLQDPRMTGSIMAQVSNIPLTKAEHFVNRGINLLEVLTFMTAPQNSHLYPARIVASAYLLSLKNAEESLLLYLFGQKLHDFSSSQHAIRVA